jgi:RNA polymerase sigma factor (sigma-70 family)
MMESASDIDTSKSPDQLADLYARTIGRSEALARGLCGDAHLAQDIAQEAFIRAAGRLPFLRDPSAFEAYLRRTVVNMCRTHAKRRATEQRSYARKANEPAMTADPRSADRDELWAAMQRLPYRQRAAIVLRYYEDLSEAQTGQVLRCSDRAINALVSRAMATLRSELEEKS